MNKSWENFKDYCPCGSGKQFCDCCQPFLSHIKKLDGPESVLRSRYCAYHFGDGEYILESWHQKYRPKESPEEISQSYKSINFLKLNIKQITAKFNRGEIDYEVNYSDEDGKIFTMKEKSKFEKFGGSWVYTKGILY